MIIGIGTDIVQIDRMEASVQRFGEAFATRILHECEWQDFKANKLPARFLAKRFAVKEAAAKALGTGFRQGLQYKDIGITYDELGCPQLVFTGRGEDLKKAKNVTQTHVSIADEQQYAIAFVVLSR